MKIGPALAAVAITGVLAGCTASASSSGPKANSSAAAAASAGADVAGQLAAAGQLCADVLQNGYPAIGVDRAKQEYDQWSAEASKEGRKSLATELAQVGTDAAATYADQVNGQNPEDALATYEQAANAAGADCMDGT